MNLFNDPGKAKAAETYDAAASHFDASPLSFWERYGRRTVERLNLPPGADVLDVGCGSGASALPAAEAVGRKGHVIGADISEGLLQLARGKAAARGIENATFRYGDMEFLGYPDDQFDAVISVFSIFFVPDMERQVAELWRMVKPGGQLAITTWGPRFLEPGSTAWWESIRLVRPDLHTAYTPWGRITEPGALWQMLSEGSVPDPDVKSETGRQSLGSPDDWWTIVLGCGYRWTVEQLDRRSAAGVRQANIAWARKVSLTSVETNVMYATARKPKG